jgi:phosphatidylglycerol:prolipoprotein diacylglycerol transferase
VRPILFHLPLIGAPVYTYGIMLGLACVLGGHLAVYLSERSGIEGKRAWWLVLTVIVIGVVGGRVHELIVLGELFSKAALAIRHSGRTAYGGYIGGTLAGIVATRMLKVRFWRFSDAVAPTLALGLGIVRIGCFCYGCDYGLRSDKWGVVFPPGSPAWLDQIQDGLIPNPDSLPAGAPTPHALPIFPVQFVASAFGFLLFAFLLWQWKRRPRRAGTVFLTFGVLYGLGRAGLEQIRSDHGRGTLLGLSTSTTIGLITAAVCLLLLFVPQLARLREDAGEILDPPKDESDAKDASAKAGGGGGDAAKAEA